MSLVAVLLAAGQGTRMKSELPKVLHTAAGRTLLSWALDAVTGVSPDRTVVVVGFGAGQVTTTLPEGIEAVTQTPQLGTGHAAAVAMGHLGTARDDDIILVTSADMPLVTAPLLDKVVKAMESAAAVMVSTELAEPFGYGRVVRTDTGSLLRVVEERDADGDQRQINEVNAGVYAFKGGLLANALKAIAPNNAQSEFYLPDVFPVLLSDGHRVEVVRADPSETMGVNSHDQLAQADSVLRGRINASWQRAGIFMQDPARVYIDAGVTLEPGVRIYPGVHLEGSTSVGPGAVIGPEVFAVDSVIGPGARVWYSVLRSAQVGEGSEVGPYASLRPGTVLGARSKAGTFVEMKNTTLGDDAKVPHLSYMGDASIGARSNIGAGSITCNFDGYEKHHTEIGEDAFIGSDTMLVAPVVVGDKAVTGAGSVITRDVEEGALAVERSVQKEVPGYAARREERHQTTAKTEE
ncbi:MAG TPA: bifunctional UDP-N-acetylglucosamine diphosphorylase/glucosamine-1-phosphate N-acetyltransferase GlmU [Acidimicrobiia bacterium]|nr:bifunctional UDP-N-acetylglucosamine diphosphorylase/glucosamine-1-phosphate N-acetyltransferase GlmU [Acidimicrobiia bacterium]